MEGKEGGDEGAAPEGAGHSVEEQKEKERVGDVEAEAGEMMAGRAQAVELHIQHVGEPGQRVPVGRVAGGESPPEALECQPGLDMEVFRDVIGIVKGDEPAAENGPVGEQGDEAEQQAEKELAGGVGSVHCDFGAERASSSCRAAAKSGLRRRASVKWRRASSGLPWVARALPRLKWALAFPGRRRRASWNCAMASIELGGAGQGEAESVVRVGVVRSEAQGFGVNRDRFLEFLPGGQKFG